MTTTYSPNLRLRLSSDLTPNARYNLLRLDDLAGRFYIAANADTRVTSLTDVEILPESDLASGGDIRLGTASHPIDGVYIYGPLLSSDPLRVLDSGSGGTKYLRLKYDSTLSGSVDTSADRTLSVDLQGADRSLVLGGALTLAAALTTSGAYALTLTTTNTTSVTLPTTGTLATLAGSESLTNKTIAAATLTGTTTNSGTLSGGTISGATLTGVTLDADTNTVSNIDNADIHANAAIALSKLAATTASRALVSDASGFVSASSVTSTELGYVSGLTSAAQTQIDTKLARDLSNVNVSGLAAGDILYASSGTALTRLAAGANGSVLVLTGGVPTWSASAGQGDVIGPGSSTDDALVRWDGTTGLAVADSSASLSDAGLLTISSLSVGSLSGVVKASAGTISASSLTNADVDAAAAIAYSKLNLSGSVVNADVSNSAAIAYSKLSLSGSVVNADVSASAAIALSKLATTTASRALVSDGSGLISASAATATEVGYLSGVSSAIQTQLDAKLAKAGGTMTGALTLAGDPATSLEAATKQYVDALSNGLKWKAAVRAATTAAGTLATDYDDGSVVDDVTLATGDRLLVKNQASASENGIYVVAASGAPARASDADAFAELNSAVVMVSEGTANADRGFIQTATLTSLSDAQTWTQNFGTGLYTADGQGIELSGSTFALELDGTTLSKSASGVKVASGGIANNEINASAAIAYSKLALTGSLLSADIAAAEKTGSGDVVLASSPTIVTPIIDDYLDINEESAPTTPSSGRVRVYAKTDKKLYLKNSDGTESAVGSGAGEKNYVAGSSTASGWANVGDLDVATTTTAADLPREYTTGSGIKITADANTQSTADYVYCDFTLDDVDLNKKLKIQWSQKTTGTYAAGDLAVVITTQADRTTALHTPITTAIPAADGTFTTSFDSGSTATLSLVIRATTDMTTNGGIVISDVVVGPGTQPQGAVVEEAKTLSVTWTNGGTISSESWKVRRVGDTAHIQGVTVWNGAGSGSNLRLNLPSGYTIDTSKLSTGSGANGNVGNAAWYDNGGTPTYNALIPFVVAGANSLEFTRDGGTALILGSDLASSDRVSATLVIPIAEWAGSGTLNVAQNDVEYASVGGTWDADSSTTVYGPGGSLMGGALAASRAKTITWPTSVQASDRIQFWGSKDQVNWFPLVGCQLGASNNFVSPPTLDSGGSGLSGVTWRPGASSNQTIVTFLRYMHAANDDSPTVDWPNSAAYWVATKSSGGQAVGYGAATSTSSGLVSTTTQTFAGAKTFSSAITASSGITFGGSTLSAYTDWTAFTASAAAVGGGSIGSTNTDASSYSRVGNVVHIEYSMIAFTVTGTVSYIGFTLPATPSTGMKVPIVIRTAGTFVVSEMEIVAGNTTARIYGGINEAAWAANATASNQRFYISIAYRA